MRTFFAFTVLVFAALPVSAQLPSSDANDAPAPPAPPATPSPPAPPASPAPPAPPAATSTATPQAAASATAKATTIGDIDGWHVVSVVGDRHLHDRRPALDACGYEQNVIVEHLGDKTGAVRKAIVVVPCVKDANGALIADAPKLQLMADEGPKPIRDDDVHKAIESHQRAIEACQKRDPTARGLINVHFLIAPNGSTQSITVLQSTLKSEPIGSCVVAEIKTWTFPQHAVAAGLPVDTAFGFDGKNSDVNKEPGRPRCKPGEKPKAEKDLARGEQQCVELVARPCAQGEKPLPPDQVGAGDLPCKEMESDRGVPFLKGELTHFGDVQLTNPKSSIGVRLGLDALDNVYFAHVEPNFNLHYGDFGLGIGAPLRFELLDLTQLNLADPSSTKTLFAHAGRFRKEDWDQIEDFLRPLRYLTYGHKEDRLFIDVNRVHSVTLGHGQLVRRYNPNVDIDEDNLFAEADGYTDFGGFELIGGPFPVPRVVGGLLFVKPLGAFYDDTLSKSFSIGATYVTDLNAPTSLEKRLNPADGRVQLAVDPTNQLIWPQRNNPVGDMVQGAGIDTEVKVLKLDFLDVKTYADYSQLFFPGDDSAEHLFDAFTGGGATVGALMRLSFGQTPVRPIEDENDDVRAGRKPREMKAGHAIRVRVEGRAFSPQYLPSYFNTLYEVDKLQYGVISPEDKRAGLPTKIAFLADQKGQPLRVGYYLEGSYDWVDVVGVTAVYEDAYPISATNAPVKAKNFALHVETFGLGFLQLFATYHYRDAQDFSGLFSFKTDNEVVYAGGRLELLPILFINVAAQRSFRVGFGKDDLAKQVDANGDRFSSIGFQNVWSAAFDVELGWQF